MALTNPPADLRNRTVPLAGIPVQLFRLNLIRHRDPVHWSKQGRYRFDSATAKYGVFYTSAAVETAILEVFGDRWIQEKLSRTKRPNAVRGLQARNKIGIRSRERGWPKSESTWHRLKPLRID
jgi:hypothetical protein